MWHAVAQAAVMANSEALSAERLADMTEQGLQGLVAWHQPLPLSAARARLLREVQVAPLTGLLAYGSDGALLSCMHVHARNDSVSCG